MNIKKRCIIISGVSAAIGGGMGSVSGSNSWVVVTIVSAVIAVLMVWGFDGMIK